MGKYKQASPLKFYLAKYFFLALSILQWTIATAIFLGFEQSLKNQYVALYFFTLGALMFVIFLVISDKIKRVALGKKKVIVIDGSRKQKIEWTQISELKLIPFFNIYYLKQKGKKKGIYFFPSKNIDPIFGLLAKESPTVENLLKKINS